MMEKSFWFIILAVVVVLGASTSYYTVDTDEEAILLRFGKYVRTVPYGLHFKMPFGIDEAIRVKTKLRQKHEFGFRTQGAVDNRSQYASGNFSDESLMLTGDLNLAEVQWVVQFQISEPEKYLFNTKDPQQNIRDVSESVMRRVVGDRAVSEVLTTGKADVMVEATRLTQEILDQYDMGIQIVNITLQDVDPPDAVKASFNEVNAAKQEQEQMINNAEKEYNRVIPRAKGRAEKEIAVAQGYAESLLNRSKGDADKFKLLLTAYRKAPRTTRERLYLEAMEDVLGKVKNLTVVDPKLDGLLPLYPKGSARGNSKAAAASAKVGAQ